MTYNNLSNSNDLVENNSSEIIISANDKTSSVDPVSTLVDNIADDLSKKIDEVASNDSLDKLVEDKSDTALDFASDLSKEGVQKVASLMETIIDKMIEEIFDKSPDKAVTDAYKVSLLKAVDENFDKIVVMLQDDIESLETKGEEFIKTSYPKFETEVTLLLKSSVSKVQDFAKKEIAELKSDFEELGDKIKVFVTKHNDIDEVQALELADDLVLEELFSADMSSGIEFSGEMNLASEIY